MDRTRRQLLAGISVAGAGVLFNACRNPQTRTGGATNDENKNEGPAPGEAEPVDVTAAEDLMREHGILRRALLVYQESATRLRQDPASVPPDALEKAVNLFRVFGEDYHEKTLEEVGQKFGVTRERVRQIQNIALNKLRKMIEKLEAVQK